MLTNSAILPFSVLTMAGWCRVSNLIKQDEANNSWVCVWKVSQDTSVLVKARPEGRGGATLTAASRPQMAAVQNCRDGDGQQCLGFFFFLFLFLYSEPPDLLVDWCELIRAVPLAGGEAGLKRNNARRGRINSVEVSQVVQFVLKAGTVQNL